MWFDPITLDETGWDRLIYLDLIWTDLTEFYSILFEMRLHISEIMLDVDVMSV